MVPIAHRRPQGAPVTARSPWARGGHILIYYNVIYYHTISHHSYVIQLAFIMSFSSDSLGAGRGSLLLLLSLLPLPLLCYDCDYDYD